MTYITTPIPTSATGTVYNPTPNITDYSRLYNQTINTSAITSHTISDVIGSYPTLKEVNNTLKEVSERLEKIEQRMNIFQVNPELEERWEELKELGDKYRELEAYILEKEHVIDILSNFE